MYIHTYIHTYTDMCMCMYVCVYIPYKGPDGMIFFIAFLDMKREKITKFNLKDKDRERERVRGRGGREIERKREEKRDLN